MSPADFIQTIDILTQEMFRGQLNISGGEPTLHYNLLEMMSYAAKRLPDAQIALFTNGHWVGNDGWCDRLRAIMSGPNILVRFSLDRTHAEGAIGGGWGPNREDNIRAMELTRLKKATMFVESCRDFAANPGVNFDFAFKGTLAEGRAYTKSLGDVPLYLIRFRQDPSKRPKELGFLAIDVNEDDVVLVYPTLGHIPTGEPLGGIDTLSSVLAMNRAELSRD